MIETTVDIGAVDGVKQKALFLIVRRKMHSYTIAVGRGGAVSMMRKVEGVYGFDRVLPDTITFERVLHYAFRRAICRGIDKAEIVETDVAVMIDLGELPETYNR